MKKNCIIIPLEKNSKFNQRIIANTTKSTTNQKLNSHVSFDSHSNFPQKNNYYQSKIKTHKNSNDSLLLKRNDLHPTINNRDYKMQTYKTEKNFESEMNQENKDSSSYKPYNSNGKIFNGQENRLVIKNNNENKENIDKNRANHSHYESKYSKKPNNEKDNYSFKAKTNNINRNLYQNENIDILNSSTNTNIKKFRRIDSNFSIKYDVENSGSKKGQEIINERIQGVVNSNDKNRVKKGTIFIKKQNSTNNNYIKNKNDNNYFQSSSSIYINNFKDIYRSPVKRIKIEKNFYGYQDNRNNIDNKCLPSISLDKKQKIENRDISKNNKIEIIKEYKTNITEMKNSSNFSLKKIPFSPKDKKNNNNNNNFTINKMTNQNKYLKLNISNLKSNNKEKHNFSYTTSKPQDNKTIQCQYNENSEKNNNSIIKRLKLTDSKTYKKTVSSDIDKTLVYKKFERENSVNNLNKSKINTLQISSNLLNEKNSRNKIINNYISHSNYISTKETINQNKNLILSRLRKDKSKDIENKDDKKTNKTMRRLNSHQHLIFNNREIKNEGQTENNKIKIIRNNLVNSGIIEYNQRNTNDILLNKSNIYDNNHIKNHSKTNLPIIKNNIFYKYNNYNNNNIENKNDIRTNRNYIHTININKINPSFLENSQHSNLNIKKNNLNNTVKNPQKQKNRYLSNFPKYQSRANFQASKNNENDKENWEDDEFMGLRKKTFDPSRRRIKNKHKNDTNYLIKNTFVTSELFSHPIFIKSCESLTVPGKKENGKIKVNQDSYVVERNINGILNFNIFGVLDGHGEDGHYASQFVSRYIISHLKNHVLLKKCEDAKEIYQKLILNGYEIIANLFIEADIQIQKEKFDYKNSGTTCVIVIQLEEKIICANAGDSRAIMIYSKNHDDNLLNTQIYNLSYDCKPELPNERKRIYENGGSVEKALDENDEPGGPYRVWVLGEDYPGLAMSRSIGDMDAKKIGVIPNPQIVEYNINDDTKYMLICSDGVWEFINNEETMKIGNKFYLRNDAHGLCQELYKKSVELWHKEDIVVDDITAIAVFF